MARSKKKSIPIITLLFIIVPVLTVGIAFAKLTKKNTKYVYAKIKVSQGLWWASTGKPNIWLAEGIKKGEIEYNLLGKPVAEILEARHYPYFTERKTNEDKFDIYLKVKLAADYNQRSQKYTFKRFSLVVGAPIEIETQSAQITGTVTELSESDFQTKKTEKTVFLTKKFAYPWEYDAIKIGDLYFDGEEVVFKVVDKYQVGTSVIAPDFYGNITPSTTDRTRYIVVKTKIKVLEKDGLLFFGEENLLNTGSTIAISTPRFNFEEFVVGKIDD